MLVLHKASINYESQISWKMLAIDVYIAAQAQLHATKRRSNACDRPYHSQSPLEVDPELLDPSTAALQVADRSVCTADRIVTAVTSGRRATELAPSLTSRCGSQPLALMFSIRHKPDAA
jgi:hypothetical protein